MTLDELAHAMRGMPREGLILVRLPDGRLAQLDHVTAAYGARDGGGRVIGQRTGSGGRYAIVLVVKP